MALVEGVVSPLKTENERGMGDRAASRQLRPATVTDFGGKVRQCVKPVKNLK